MYPCTNYIKVNIHCLLCLFPNSLPFVGFHLPLSMWRLEIKDGSLLAYLFRIPDFLVQQLVETDQQLPEIDTHHQRKIDPQGRFPIRHFATWADSSLDIFHSKDYLSQQSAYVN